MRGRKSGPVLSPTWARPASRKRRSGGRRLHGGGVPHDGEVARGVSCDRRIGLRAARSGVDEELRTLRVPGGVEPPAPHVEVALEVVAGPDDDECATRVHGDRGLAFSVRAGRVDLELGAHGRRGGVEHPAKDAAVAAVLAETLPDDDELSRCLHRDDRATLEMRGVGVDLDLAGERLARLVEAAEEHAFEVAVLRGAVPTTTKLSFASIATAGRACRPVVKSLTRTSPPDRTWAGAAAAPAATIAHATARTRITAAPRRSAAATRTRRIAASPRRRPSR